MSFCECCSEIFRRHIFRCATRVGHHKSIANLVDAADQGCLICQRAFQNLTPESQGILRYYGRILLEASTTDIAAAALPSFTEMEISVMQVVDSSFKDWSTTTPPGIDLSIHLNAKHRVEMQERGIINHDANLSLRIVEKLQRPTTGILRVTLYRSSGYPNVVVAKPRSTTTGSAETWEVVRTWLQECTSGHRACNMAKPEWYPSRLVDIGSSGGSPFSIVSGSEVSPGQKYITLSHRWGLSNIPRITIQNLPAFKRGKPASVLPPSFQHAMIIARRLDIRYIWIDSLCIIQDGDNGHDWRQEAPLMKEVFANAFCSLSANWASDSAGLFFHRDVGLFNQVQQRLLLKDDDGGIFSESYTLFSAGDNWANEVLDAPLNKRGWVLQERILARRIIHFCRREIFWECCEKTVSESFPAMLPPTHPNTGNPLLASHIQALKQMVHSRKNGVPAEIGPREGEAASRLYGIWHSIVELYTKCRLTKQSDKLVAIAGLARSLSPFLQDRYIAGVWSKNLVNELTWYVKEPEPVSRGSSHPYRAPSFSWASANGHTLLPLGLQYPCTGSLVQLACVKPRRLSGHNPLVIGHTEYDELLTEDICGPCDSPAVELRVTGSLHAAVLTRPNQQRRPQPGSNEPSHIASIAKIDKLRFLRQKNAISIALDNNLDEDDEEESLFYYVPWVYNPTIAATLGGPSIPGLLIALILELVDPELGQFRRAGVIEARDPTADTRASLLDSQEEDGALYPCWRFDKKSGLHTFYIV